MQTLPLRCIRKNIAKNHMVQPVSGSHAAEVQCTATERKTRICITTLIGAVTGVIAISRCAVIVDVFDANILHVYAAADDTVSNCRSLL